mgnify:CR=1 FL=1
MASKFIDEVRKDYLNRIWAASFNDVNNVAELDLGRHDVDSNTINSDVSVANNDVVNVGDNNVNNSK